jgi:hypothetical protein
VLFAFKCKKKWRNIKFFTYVLVVGGQVRPAEHCQPGGSPLEHTGQVPCPEVCGNHPGMMQYFSAVLSLFFLLVYLTGFRIRINLSCLIRIRIQIADPDPGGQK